MVKEQSEKQKIAFNDFFFNRRMIREYTGWSDNREVEYIEVILDDIEKANRLANEVLGQSLDELAPPIKNAFNLNLSDGKGAIGEAENCFQWFFL